MHVLICGGGALGACTAYFLSRRGIAVTVVERVGVAAAASGKAGGFLALDWCAGTPLDALARRSFALHAHLTQEVNGDWGYRGMTAYAGVVSPDDRPPSQTGPVLDWLSASVHITHRLGTSGTTAIVHPGKFTAAMISAAQAHGARLRHGRVTGVLRETGGATAGVEVDGRRITGDAVVIAMGPWSLLASQWMQLPGVFGQRSPSLVYQTGSAIPADALFLELQDGGHAASVEVFPRADGSTLITAFSEIVPVPLDPAEVIPAPNEIESLQAIAGRVSPLLRPERIVARQACFRPVTQDGLPLIGKVPESRGLYVATGHNVWGILAAPATGEAMADLIAEGAAEHVDLSAFDPARLPPFQPPSKA